MELDRRNLIALGLAAVGTVSPPAMGRGALTRRFAILDLRVDGLTEPLATGDRVPHFSWKLAGSSAGLRQSAYRVTVARSAVDLATGRNLVWDSGRVTSAETFDIRYGGAPAAPRTRLWWRVESWVAGEQRSVASRPSFWETGLVSPSDWSAQWLACETATARRDREAGLHWITGSGMVRVDQERAFRTVLLADAPETAELLVSGSHVAGVWLNGLPLVAQQDDPVSWTTMAVYPLPLLAGRNAIAVEVKRVGGFGTPPPILAAIVRRGPISRATTAEGWKTSLAGAAQWRERDFDDSGWEPAIPVATKPVGEPWPTYPAVLLRHDFRAKGAVRSARLYATALGVYEAWINGQRVGDARMAPEFTDARKHILYQAYDVTALVRGGENAIGLWVGDGWYGSEYSNGSRFAFGPAPCRVRAQLELGYEDGSTEIVETGDGWATAPSPILSSEIYDGEIYDARLDQPGWATAGFTAAGWRAADRAEPPAVPIEPQRCPPIRVTKVLQPVKISEPLPGVHVADFGQNFAGWPRLRVRGPAGTRVELRFGEVLKPSGEVDQANLRTAWARDIYILGGRGEEVWEPRFTYHGFRYVELRGLPGPPDADTIAGLVGHTDLRIAGAFRVGDQVIQQFWRNSVWSQRSNFFGLATDCPQRDERLGWMGDAAVFWPAAAYNMDVEAFTARVMTDVRHGQSQKGAFPDVIPPFQPGLSLSSPGWADAGVILPHTAWRQYGATGVVTENWDAMERYLALILANNPDHLWKKSRGADYGDWLAVDAKQPGDPTTPKDLIGTAFWAADAMMMAEMAEAIGRPADAARYRALFESIRAAFVDAYVQADGTIGNGSQTSYVLPIRFGLLTPGARAEAGRRLAADIARRGDRLSTGFLGTPHILDALAATGQERAAVTLLLQRGYPSWGYMVEQGATTMWERWNSDHGDLSMNSYNHYAFGAIGAFLYRRIAGIDPAQPGFRHVRIAPIFDRRLKGAGADYHSVMGPIRTDWRYEGDGLRLDVSLPPNVTGEVTLPGRAGRIRLGRQPLTGRAVTARGATTQVRIGPGDHSFVVTA